MATRNDLIVALASIGVIGAAATGLLDGALNSTFTKAAAVADIPTPASATATDCANKINALLASLRTAGLLTP